MTPGHEPTSPAGVPPAGDGAAAPPPPAPPAADGPPPDAVLRWVAAVAPKAWFPATHSRDAGVPRDALDAPLARLRTAGLVHATDWVRGLGQGYTLTDAGTRAVAAPAGVTPAPPPPPDRPPATPAPRPRDDDPDAAAAAAAFRDLTDPEPDRPAGPRPVVVDRRTPVVTPLLMAANVGWFAVGLGVAYQADVPAGTYLRDGTREVLTRLGAVDPMALVRGEWWRLFACCFVHIGWIHLLVNLYALGVCGPLAEAVWGRWRFLAVYLLAGLGGSCLAMALPASPDLLLAGASGCIWGVLTSLVAWLSLYGDRLGPGASAAYLRRLMLVLLVNTVLSLLPGISL